MMLITLLLLQHLAKLLLSLERLAVQTQPFQVRETIASDLLKLWPLVLSAGQCDVVRCCKLVVGLLQDADSDVRREMATAVSKLLASKYCQWCWR